MTVAERMVERMEVWPIERLTPYARNARTHSEAQVAQIAASISRFGFNNPILVASDTGIVAGHGRYQAARKLGLSRVPVIVLDHLSEAERRAYVIADNKIAENAGWDEDLLTSELAALNEMEFDLETLGFSERELEKMLGAPDDSAADACPDVPEQAVTVAGDLWLLGRHRLLAGDATKREDVERVMAGEKANLMVADPPYGVNLDQSWRDGALPWQSLGQGNSNKVTGDDRADWYEVWAGHRGDVAYVWHASAFSDVVKHSLERADFEVKQQIIWNKTVMVMSRSNYHWKHEPCWYAVRKGATSHWTGDRTQVTVWDAAAPNHIMAGSSEEKTEHPTQKPIVLYEIPISNHTHAGDAVYDPFGGSGTAVIACEKTGRAARLLEIDPRYCDVILKRWQDYTGQKAVRESDGRAFDELAAALTPV